MLKHTTLYSKDGEVIRDRWEVFSPDGSPSRQSASSSPPPADEMSPRGRELQRPSKPRGRGSAEPSKASSSPDVIKTTISPKKRFPLRFSVAKSKPALPTLPAQGIAKLIGALSDKELTKVANTLEKVLSGHITDWELAVNNILAQFNSVLKKFTVPESLQEYFKYGTTGEDFANALLDKLLEGKKKKNTKDLTPADRETALYLLTRAFSAVAETQEQNKLSDETVSWQEPNGKTHEFHKVASWQDPDGITFEGEFVRLLGGGAFGKASKYRVNEKLSVAVKQTLIDPDQLEYAKFVRSLQKQMSELDTQTRAGGHGNVIELYGVIKQSHGPIVMIMELAENGELTSIMAPSDAHPTSKLHQLSEQAPKRAQNVLLCILKDLFAGLSHIHRKGVGHHDFKPENIFIGHDGTLKVADFGEATLLKLMSVFTDVEEERYLAPEVILLRQQAEAQGKLLVQAQYSTWKEADEKLLAEVTMLLAQKRELPETDTKIIEIDKRLEDIRKERTRLGTEYRTAEKEAKERVINESKKTQENIAAILESIAPEKVEGLIQEYLQEGNYLFHPQRADKWSLGVSIYYTLFGTPPFKPHRETDGDVPAQILDFRRLNASQRRQFLRLDPVTDPTVKKLLEDYKIPLNEMPMWLDDKVKDFVVELMFNLLDPDPMQRPDLKTALDTLLEHPLFLDEGAQLQTREDILDMAKSGKPQ